MNKIPVLLFWIMCSLSLEAQDILVRKGGEVEIVKVLDVSPTEVRYKMSNNPDGPILTEKHSNLYSVKYQNGNVLTFNDKYKEDNETSVYSNYGSKEKITSFEFELFIARGWGVGIQIRRELNPYMALDILGISYMSRFRSTDETGLVNVRPIGLRFQTSAYKAIRGYTSLKLGYSFGYKKLEEAKEPDNLNSNEGTTYINEHFFGFDFSAGIQFHQYFAIGYNLNFVSNNNVELANHMIKLSIIF